MSKKHPLLALFVCILPGPLKLFIYRKIFRYSISSSSRIGFSYININYLEMDSNSSIGNFNFIGNFDSFYQGKYATVSSFNWITGFSTKLKSKHFAHQKSRLSSLILGDHSAITKHHHIDCTNTVEIGCFTTIAGYYSQFLTHSINIEQCIQDSHPIKIGNYCFIGTRCVFLGNSFIPDYCVVGANSLANKVMPDSFSLYCGSPLKKTKNLARSHKYFSRNVGFVT